MYNKSTEKKAEILIVDDKLRLCQSLAQNFRQLGYHTHTATNAAKAFNTYRNRKIDVVILDIRLGEEDGIEVLRQLRSLNDSVPVIMITAYGTIETAVQSMKLGALEFLQKPINFDKLVEVIERTTKARFSTDEEEKPRGKLIASLSPLVSCDDAMRAVCKKARQLADTELPILICGESGTGKELLADFIHSSSSRSSHRIVKINCSAFAESLLDNELFGHEKGAYTGADSTFRGVFERADNGTLFLDEIGDMPVAIQSKILRALQNMEIHRVGGKDTIKVNVRFIAATNRNLQQLIGERVFREDLLYRLNAATLRIPPLRERKEDIPLLVDHFLREFPSPRSQKKKRVSDEAMHVLIRHDWPGNIRELKNTLQYAAAVSLGDSIEIGDLPPGFVQDGWTVTANIREKIERDLIVSMLVRTRQNKKKTAELLKMSRKTLYNKLQKYGISPSRG
jgi:DNA-binding NtrC family response regulator